MMPIWLDQFSEALAARYVLERELGQGGMAVVYLAHDRRHHRPVAIKVLRPDTASALGPERFLREIAIVAPLVHPHIVSLLDSGEAGGALFYVMPYISGDSLRARLAQHGELSVAETIRIMRGVFSALAYAHAAGIVHRDIKPENILLASDHPQVADFGIARALASVTPALNLTGTGHAIGTTAYMAPEQAAGDPALDHRADLYSAGMLWYELLTRRHPFADLSPQQQMAAHFVREIPSAHAVRPAIPPGLADLVGRCLEKDPADRWQQASDILRQLDTLLSEGSAGTLHPAGEPSVRRFKITEPLLDLLSGDYDPRMSGDTIQYLDNGKISDVLVCYFNRWCMDPQDGAELLRRTPFRAVAPAFFGFESGRRYRVLLSLDDHLRLIGGLLDELIATNEPKFVVLVGFSAGADLALRLAADHAKSGERQIHGVVAISPNLVKESAFASAVLARMTVGGEDEVLPYLRRVTDAQQTLQEWADVSEYLARLARRFRDDFRILQAFAADIAMPFEEGPRFSAFSRWYDMSASQGRTLRIVFEDTPLCRQLVSELHRAHKHQQLLGAHYRAGSLVMEPGTGHFDVEGAECISGHLHVVVEQLRAR